MWYGIINDDCLVYTHKFPTIGLLSILSKKLTVVFIYSLIHKTLPKSSLQMHWNSVRFYGRYKEVKYRIFNKNTKKKYV